MTKLRICSRRGCDNRAHGAYAVTLRVPKVLPGDVELDETQAWITVGRPTVVKHKDGTWGASGRRVFIHTFTVERVMTLCAACSLDMKAKVLKMYSEPTAVGKTIAPEREVRPGVTASDIGHANARKRHGPSTVSPAIQFGTDAMHKPGVHNRKWWD